MAREKLKINPLDLDTVVSSKIRNTDIELDAGATLLSQRPSADQDELDVDALVEAMSTGKGQILDKKSFLKPKAGTGKAA
jgi:hypothetical protein